MRLLDHQIALGGALRVPGPDVSAELTADALRSVTVTSEELVQLIDLVASPGFRFTRRVRRSWSRGRAARVARLTLSVLPMEEHQQLVDDWVEAGGSTSFDPIIEAVAFLDFVGSRLPDPSHALTLCRMERATYRASAAALRFEPPNPAILGDPNISLKIGSGASLVRFLAEPAELLAAVEAGAPLPPIADRSFPLLFAPGLTGLVREPSDAEESVWEQLARPTTIDVLTRYGHTRGPIKALFDIGAVELASPMLDQASRDNTSLFCSAKNEVHPLRLGV
jgi:hypothetical protein